MNRKLRIFPVNCINSKKNQAIIANEIEALQQDPLFFPGWIHFILVADYQVQKRYMLSLDSFAAMMKSKTVQYEVKRKLSKADEEQVAAIVILISGLNDYDYCVVEKVSRSGLVEA